MPLAGAAAFLYGVQMWSTAAMWVVGGLMLMVANVDVSAVRGVSRQ